jgi:hypothetical protein
MLRRVVYDAIWKLQPCTDRMICKDTGLEINTETERRNELLGRGYIKESYKALCPITGHNAIFWIIKYNKED